MLIVGLMTGTSLDGIDAALVEITGDSVDTIVWKLIASTTTPYTVEQREEIHAAIISGSAEKICLLDARMGELLADAALAVCATAGVSPTDVMAIGSHGQTIWHHPPAGERRGATLQVGCPATIAEATGVSVISDFRSRDVAAGGQGAPLVPWVDHVLFAVPGRARALQNIGGMGNVTWVAPRESTESLLAFDTGPGNSLIDAAVSLGTNDRLRFDEGGRLAARGRVDPALLNELLGHPFFEMPPPRSTGRETFGRPFVERLVEVVRPEGDQDWLDLVATLTELTARSVVDSLERWIAPRCIDEIVITGGGAMNGTLVARIEAMAHPIPVLNSDVLGIGAGDKEALAFAVLAWAHLKGIPANAPTATGAKGPRILGSFTPASGAEARR